MKHIPGIDMSSGSLGQGVSVAVGMAAAGKYDKKDYRVYTSQEMARFRRDRSGRQPCGQATASSTIS